jgi:hypothetical protein
MFMALPTLVPFGDFKASWLAWAWHPSSYPAHKVSSNIYTTMHNYLQDSSRFHMVPQTERSRCWVCCLWCQRCRCGVSHYAPLFDLDSWLQQRCTLRSRPHHVDLHFLVHLRRSEPRSRPPRAKELGIKANLVRHRRAEQQGLLVVHCGRSVHVLWLLSSLLQH